MVTDVGTNDTEIGTYIHYHTPRKDLSKVCGCIAYDDTNETDDQHQSHDTSSAKALANKASKYDT